MYVSAVIGPAENRSEKNMIFKVLKIEKLKCLIKKPDPIFAVEDNNVLICSQSAEVTSDEADIHKKHVRIFNVPSKTDSSSSSHLTTSPFGQANH